MSDAAPCFVRESVCVYLLHQQKDMRVLVSQKHVRSARRQCALLGYSHSLQFQHDLTYTHILNETKLLKPQMWVRMRDGGRRKMVPSRRQDGGCRPKGIAGSASPCNVVRRKLDTQIRTRHIFILKILPLYTIVLQNTG